MILGEAASSGIQRLSAGVDIVCRNRAHLEEPSQRPSAAVVYFYSALDNVGWIVLRCPQMSEPTDRRAVDARRESRVWRRGP